MSKRKQIAVGLPLRASFGTDIDERRSSIRVIGTVHKIRDCRIKQDGLLQVGRGAGVRRRQLLRQKREHGECVDSVGENHVVFILPIGFSRAIKRTAFRKSKRHAKSGEFSRVKAEN